MSGVGSDEFFFFFKQKTAYGMRISDWSSDVCSSDLLPVFVQYEGCRVQVGVDRAALYYRGAGRTLEAAAAVGADGEAAKEVHAHGRPGIPADIVEVDLAVMAHHRRGRHPVVVEAQIGRAHV